MKPRLPLTHGGLRPASGDDLDDVLALLHEPEVRRYLCDDALLPRAAVEDMLDRSLALDAQGLGLWVVETADGACAGLAGLQPAAAELGDAPDIAGGTEALIALHPDHWGRGLAGRAVGALAGYAAVTLGLDRLVAGVDEPNAASHRLLERLGFKRFGETPGPAHTLVLYILPLETA